MNEKENLMISEDSDDSLADLDRGTLLSLGNGYFQFVRDDFIGVPFWLPECNRT
jgi:hypothetical protein